MESLVHEIFTEYNYRVLDKSDEHHIEYGISGQDKEDYYICCFWDETIDLSSYSKQVEAEFADELYYTGNNHNSAKKKNTSIIFFIDASDVLKYEEENQKLLYDIEESPYYLKKYVLTYNTSQIQEFRDRYDTDNTEGTLSIREKMEKIISDIDGYKKSRAVKSVSLYSLVLRLYAKIPFTSYDVKPVLKVDELISEIDKCICEQENELIDQIYRMCTDKNDKPSRDKLGKIANEIEISTEEIDEYIKLQLKSLEGD